MSGWATRFVDSLLERRRITFTRTEIESALGRSPAAVYLALRRLVQQGRVAMPRNGFYVVLDPPHIVPPPEEWIDDLMRFHEARYYVGLLTAAALHGAADFPPLDLQVVAGATFRPMDSVPIRFHYRRKMTEVVVDERPTPYGTFRVSTPEMTALDLVRYRVPFEDAAAAIARLAGRLDRDRLVAACRSNGSFPDIQRLGYLLDLAGRGEILARWSRGASSLGVAWVPLVVGAPCRGCERDRRWRVLVNTSLGCGG